MCVTLAFAILAVGVVLFVVLESITLACSVAVDRIVVEEEKKNSLVVDDVCMYVCMYVVWFFLKYNYVRTTYAVQYYKAV